MAAENLLTANVQDPLGVLHTYRGTGITFAQADAELKAKLKTVVGTLLGITVSSAMDDTPAALLVPSSQTNQFGDLRLTVFKVVNGRTILRTIGLQDMDKTLINTNGKPDKSKQTPTDIASWYEDADYGTGFQPYRVRWEKKFSG